MPGAARARGPVASSGTVARLSTPPPPTADPPVVDLRPPRPAGPTARPALMVFFGALALFLLGVVALALSGSTAPTAAPVTVHTAKGAPLTAVPAASLLGQITSGGQPPSDILSSLAAPEQTTAVAGSAVDNSEGSYDHELRLRVPSTEAKAIAFWKAQLPSQGWTNLSSGPPSAALRATPGSIEVLARHASEDGNYWEVGFIMGPTVFPPGGAQFTPVTLQLYVVADEQ